MSSMNIIQVTMSKSRKRTRDVQPLSRYSTLDIPIPSKRPKVNPVRYQEIAVAVAEIGGTQAHIAAGEQVLNSLKATAQYSASMLRLSNTDDEERVSRS